MRGSLHCATDGEAARCSGRDDGCVGVIGEEQATAKAKAGSFGCAQDRLFDCGGKSAAFAQDDNFGGVWKRTSNSKCKDEIRGSLHYAMDDKAVHCFGRDDGSVRQSHKRDEWGTQRTGTRAWPALVLGGGLLDVVDDQDGVGALGLFQFQA